MEARDRRVTVLGVVAVLISVGLGTAFATGPLEPPDLTPTDRVVEWDQALSSRSEVGSNDQVLRFDIREHNVTRVTVRLTWQDDELVSPLGVRADTLSLTVEGPSTLSDPSRTETGTGGELVLEFDVADVPTDTDIENMVLYDDTNGTGEWSVTVSVQASGIRDTGNDWAISLSYAYYAGRQVESPEDT